MDKIIERQQKEISAYKYALDESAILSITDQHGVINYVNDHFIAVSKYSKDELLGQDHRILNSGLHTKEFMHDLRSTISVGRIWKGELRNRAKDGTHYWVDTTIVPFLNEVGEPYQYHNIAIDISDRKRTEEQLVEFKYFFEQSNDLLSIANTSGFFEVVNPTFLTTLGYTENELKVSPFFDFIHPDDLVSTLEEVNKLKEGVLTINFINRYRKKNGEYAWLAWNTTPDTKTGKLYAVCRDITLQRAAEQALKNSLSETSELNQELEAFSYSVAHDLRTPLRSVHGYAEILNEDYTKLLDDEGRRIIGSIKTNVIKMGKLIDDLLAFSRLGRKELNVESIDMNILVQDVIADINKTTKHKANVLLGNLPNVVGDYSLIYRVMVNLLSNAIKYSSKKAEPEIRIESTIQNDETIFSMKDNGAGFDMKYADKLFGVFQRLHTERDFEGTGIGLAIVHRIIAKHKGRVWAEGIVNEGATFNFTLQFDR